MTLLRSRSPGTGSLALLLFVTTLAACSQPKTGEREIGEPSQRSPADQGLGEDLVWDASSAQRFGFQESMSSLPGGGAGGAGGAAAELSWITPPGWSELPSSSMRTANFLVAGDQRAECYLTVLAGDGGGLLANVNRWRKQMSLREVTAQDLVDAPRVPMLGAEAVLVDLEGTWTGMSGDQSGAGYRLLGLLAVDAGGARFLKMVGPSDVLEGEREAFLALAASFSEGGSRPTARDEALPAGQSPGGLSWTAPPGWRPAPARVTREVTFLLGAEEDPAECYVAVLGGDGGGVLPNINRWRNQMEQRDLSQDEFEQLSTVEMLGTAAVLVEVAGTYRGMGDELVERGYLLGAVCALPGRAVFVKLVGPEASVLAAREDFLSFCRSLR